MLWLLQVFLYTIRDGEGGILCASVIFIDRPIAVDLIY